MSNLGEVYITILSTKNNEYNINLGCLVMMGAVWND